ncbi:MAG: 1-deoxy-D-xylulose-5-phosphate synthase [Lachnospiraceae bacterium]|nr:1-deoxy-D-xylulose-5-phosphate synthase [Lachnospiraceae bacterium]
MILDRIKKPNDIKKIRKDEYSLLAQEIRTFLIKKISSSGGHLGSNLGVVELTMALHLSLTLPEDKIIFDVGHQSYTHKILTGRRPDFDTLRQFGGLSGFPKYRESECDAFDTGHSSTSISAGMGLVKARDLLHQTHTVVSVIGDGALTGGMVYEALNNASRLRTNFIIILNDNNMSISENVGGISKYLQSIRTAEGYQDFKVKLQEALLKVPKYGEVVVDRLKRYKNSIKQIFVPGMFFEDIGITYLGPVDGHDITAMMKVIKEAKKVNHAVIIHVRTKKGLGYAPAERHPARFHGTGPFDIETGLPSKNKVKPDYSDIFSTVMLKLAANDDKVCAITAAMPDGTGLTRFSSLYPDRFFDVGIAEAHAVTFAAGLARGGMIPVVAVYSSFLQRAFDQIIHDVCIQNLHVILAIDRAGIVGADGETHQGIFDLSFLSEIPNMTVMAPKNKWELSDMMKFAHEYEGPIALRYPRGEAYDGLEGNRAKIIYGKAEIIGSFTLEGFRKYHERKDETHSTNTHEGFFPFEKVTILAVGSMIRTAITVCENLRMKGIASTLVNARFVKPVDSSMVRQAAASSDLLVTLEENVLLGGFGEHVRAIADKVQSGASTLSFGIPDTYVEHGNVKTLEKTVGIDADSITNNILAAISLHSGYVTESGSV